MHPNIKFRRFLQSIADALTKIAALGFLDASLLSDKSNPKLIDQYGLSKRQAECLYYLMENNSIKEIALKLELSPRTVEHYLVAVKSKLGCRTRIELIKKASQLIM